jgi:hypothetical protein
MGSSLYLINSVGMVNAGNPGLTLCRGNTYKFNVAATGHPFWIKTAATTGRANGATGVTGNGLQIGDITFVVPNDAPASLFYICEFHGGMTGTLTVRNP